MGMRLSSHNIGSRPAAPPPGSHLHLPNVQTPSVISVPAPCSSLQATLTASKTIAGSYN